MEDKNKVKCFLSNISSYVKKVFLSLKDNFVFKSKIFNDLLVLIKDLLLFLSLGKIFKDAEFKKRFISAIIFGFIFFTILLIGGALYILLIGIIFCLAIYELLKMIKNLEEKDNKLFLNFRNYGVIYLIIFCISLILIRESSQGLKISTWLFFTTWIVDSFSYIFGKKFGSIKLAPVISPNKTYEGAILGGFCGFIFSMVFYKLFSMELEQSFSFLSFTILSIIFLILCQIGDLMESYVKRQCNIKDSGNIIRGHGGILDRFDSLLIVAPFIFLIILLNGGIIF